MIGIRKVFFPDAISSWNGIITNFEYFPTRDTLKEHLLSFFRRKSKSIFGLHDPEGLRHLFQLRAGLSFLRSHKKQHHFLDTQSDICLCNQGIEDAYVTLYFRAHFMQYIEQPWSLR